MGFDFVFFEYFLLYSIGISIGARKTYKEMYVIDINDEIWIRCRIMLKNLEKILI